MAASKETITEVIQVVKKHVSPEVFQRIITDLMLVKGNQSFEASIRLMQRTNQQLDELRADTTHK
jgi:hypothetical protein